METVIGAVLGGAQDRSENQQMAKQAVEVPTLDKINSRRKK